jgi:hypothetical protein
MANGLCGESGGSRTLTPRPVPRVGFRWFPELLFCQCVEELEAKYSIEPIDKTDSHFLVKDLESRVCSTIIRHISQLIRGDLGPRRLGREYLPNANDKDVANTHRSRQHITGLIPKQMFRFVNVQTPFLAEPHQTGMLLGQAQGNPFRNQEITINNALKRTP